MCCASDGVLLMTFCASDGVLSMTFCAIYNASGLHPLVICLFFTHPPSCVHHCFCPLILEKPDLRTCGRLSCRVLNTP